MITFLERKLSTIENENENTEVECLTDETNGSEWTVIP